MLDRKYIAGEINALGLVCPDDATLDAVVERANQYLGEDEFVVREVLEKVDAAIFEQNLPEMSAL